MAEERTLSLAEVRKTIATSLGAAFGFVIALMWNNVVLGGLATGSVPTGTSSTPGNWAGWAYSVVMAVLLTVVMIVFIVVIGRWGGKD
jgi:hypothetical protein